MGRQQQERSITRRELATSVGVHPDSLSRVLADGLASAVLVWGGRGQEQRFSLALAHRFIGAWRCRQHRECAQCARVLEDCQAVAEHLIGTRHGYGGCLECRITWEVCQPCGRF